MPKKKSTPIDDRGDLPSASSMERRYCCPGSKHAEKGAPPAAPTDEAIEGDEIHAALEDEDFTALDDEGRNIATRIRMLEDQAVSAWQELYKIDRWDFLKEERLWIRDRHTLKPVASAKPDRVYVRHAHALVIDFKTGYIPTTPARRNIQMRIQALAVWHENPQVETVVVAIAQHRFRSTLDTTVYDLHTLKRAEEEMLFNLWRGDDPFAPRVPGDWCKYCRAKGADTCPQSAAYAMLPVAKMATAVDIKDPFLAHKLVGAVATMSLEDLAVIRAHKSITEKIFDAVDTRLKSMSPETLAKVGLGFSKPSEVRSIPDIKSLWDILHHEGLMTADEFRMLCKVPVGAIVEALVPILKDRYGLETAKEAKQKADEIILPAVARKPKAPSLIKVEKQISEPSSDGADA